MSRSVTAASARPAPKDVADVVGTGQRPYPGVEQLDGARAGLGLDTQERAEICASLEHSASQSSGSPCIKALVCSWFFDGPPSTR